MVKTFLYPLLESVKAFNIFRYISFRSAYAAVTALLISFLLGPWVIKKLKELKIGQEIRADGPQSHFVKAGTPTMGGILILIAFSIAVFIWQDWESPYFCIILLAAFGFGILGFLDDYIKISKKNADGLHARLKFFGQLLVSFAVMMIVYFTRNSETTLLYIPFLKNPVMDLGIFYIPFGMLMIVAVSNAVNITDGLDGLSTGLIVITLIAYTILTYLTGHAKFAEYLFIPYIQGAGELTIATTALTGACVGFLWFNAHPAEIMMGDTGSLTLGGVLAVIAILVKKEFLFLIIGGVFVMEIGSVVIQVLYFKKTGKRFFRIAPFHHNLEAMGWAENKIVTRFWILGSMFAILGLSTLKIQ